MALSAFAEHYKETLRSELTTIDRNSINFLKGLAQENEHEHLNIIVAVQQHMYEAPPAQHLPTLYLVDCILKVVGQPYLAPFCVVLPGMFRFAWERADGVVRKSMVKLAATWTPLLPAVTTAAVNDIIAASSRASPSPMQPVVQQQQQQQQRMASPSHGHAPAPVPMRRADHVPPPQQQQQPVPMRRDPRVAGTGPPPLAAYAAVPAPQQQSLMSVMRYPPAQPQPQSTASTSYPQAAVQRPQQPAQRPQQPMQRPQQPTVPVPAPAPAVPAASKQDLMDLLLSLGNKLAGAGGGSQTAGAGHGGDGSGGGGAPGKLRSAAPAGKVIGALDFNPSILKEEDASAVEELLDASEQSRRRFRDRRFLRTRRIKAAKANGTPLSQSWFYPVDAWLMGTRVEDGEADLQGGLEDEDAEMCALEAQHNVEEDPSQVECAICGEPFERWYDPDTDKWFYGGAVVLSVMAEAAATNGCGAKRGAGGAEAEGDAFGVPTKKIKTEAL
ncbi:hypothetical protein FOA52_001980 [Chlamydomonas sp. UWO 241]|nr:hypothetical protein FOA52_001980 [Chlamydomonas sp. UWO 241]